MFFDSIIALILDTMTAVARTTRTHAYHSGVNTCEESGGESDSKELGHL